MGLWARSAADGPECVPCVGLRVPIALTRPNTHSINRVIESSLKGYSCCLNLGTLHGVVNSLCIVPSVGGGRRNAHLQALDGCIR